MIHFIDTKVACLLITVPTKWIQQGASMKEDSTEVSFCRVITCKNWCKYCRGHCTHKTIIIDEFGKCKQMIIRE